MIRLEQLRLDARLTPEQLGEKIGVTGRTIRRIESEHTAATTTLWKLADVLEARPSELLLPVVTNGAAA